LEAIATMHGSWLNMAEIEINMMDRECLARRIGEAEKLENEINCWSRERFDCLFASELAYL